MFVPKAIPFLPKWSYFAIKIGFEKSNLFADWIIAASRRQVVASLVPRPGGDNQAVAPQGAPGAAVLGKAPRQARRPGQA